MTRAMHRSALAAAVIVVVTATAVIAAPGDLDASFSMDGIAVVDFGGTSQEFQRGAPDGAKVVAVGAVDGDFAVARLRAGGALDDGFAGDGRRTLDFGHEDYAYGVAVHRDSRISVVGFANDAQGDGRVAVARFTRGGGLDTSFSGDGMMTTRSPDGVPVFGYDAVVQPDGKLVVVGETYDGDAGKFFAMRLRTDGSIDRSFGDDGKVLVNPGPGADGAWRVALTGTGRLVLAGWSEGAGASDDRSVAVRLLPDGRRDRSFAGDGIWLRDLSPDGDDAVAGLDLTDDDQILLGINLFSSAYDPHVVQLRKGGAFDPRFGGGDGISSNWADGFRLEDVEIGDDGQIAGALVAALLVRHERAGRHLDADERRGDVPRPAGPSGDHRVTRRRPLGGPTRVLTGEHHHRWPTRYQVSMAPLPLTSIVPRDRQSNASRSNSNVARVIWISPGVPLLSMRLAVFTASPHRS
jgi:uncharacterized delta-60 repeat protein